MLLSELELPYFSFIFFHVQVRFAAANNVLEGTHPVQVQSPPTFDASTRHTDFPKVAANLAAVRPADPPPMTMMSYLDADAASRRRRLGSRIGGVAESENGEEDNSARFTSRGDGANAADRRSDSSIAKHAMDTPAVIPSDISPKIWAEIVVM